MFKKRDAVSLPVPGRRRAEEKGRCWFPGLLRAEELEKPAVLRAEKTGAGDLAAAAGRVWGGSVSQSQMKLKSETRGTEP
ncbi:glyoxalase [Sesbania bispinosa]|nr:glyoxalase [Sesbania bispinosa]